MDDFLSICHPADTLDTEILYHDIGEYIPFDTGGEITHIRFATRYCKGDGPKKQGKGYYSSFVPVSIEQVGDKYMVSNIPIPKEYNHHDLCFLGDKGRIFSKKNLQTLHEKLRNSSHFAKVMAEIKIRYSRKNIPAG